MKNKAVQMVALALAAVLTFASVPVLADTGSVSYEKTAEDEDAEETDDDGDYVAPDEDGGDDSENIKAQLEATGRAVLYEGKTYHLYKRIYLDDGDEIVATGAKIVGSGMMITSEEEGKGYNTLKGATIKGGTWVNSSSSGFKGTGFKFMHSSNIKLINMTIECCNYDGHSIELIACKNVTIKNCDVIAQGSAPSDCNQEQIQIDIDAPATSTMTVNNGKTCKNIKIIGCEVVGCRAICANYAATDRGSYLNKFHSKITVKNCKLTGKTAEALALFNTTSATVTGNTIITKASRSRDSYSDGMAVTYFGKGAKSGTITISKNTIKGKRHALLVYSHSSSKFGTVNIKGNKLYCSDGASNALKTGSVSKLNASGNKTHGW